MLTSINRWLPCRAPHFVKSTADCGLASANQTIHRKRPLRVRSYGLHLALQGIIDLLWPIKINFPVSEPFIPPQPLNRALGRHAKEVSSWQRKSPMAMNLVVLLHKCHRVSGDLYQPSVMRQADCSWVLSTAATLPFPGWHLDVAALANAY